MAIKLITSSQQKLIQAALQREAGKLSLGDLARVDAQRVLENLNLLPMLVRRVLIELVFGDGEPASHTQMRELMGRGFYGLAEAGTTFGSATIEQKVALATIPSLYVKALEAMSPSERLEWLLFPDLGTSTFAMHGQHSQAFVGQIWQGDEAMRPKEAPCWRLMHRICSRATLNKNWDEQCALVPACLEVSSARQLVYAVVLRMIRTGKTLQAGIRVRTSDVYSYGERVVVARCAGYGLPGLGVGILFASESDAYASDRSSSERLGLALQYKQPVLPS